MYEIFPGAFRREAKFDQYEREFNHTYWRHKERGWEVVSTRLHEKWDNATHPEDHDDFSAEGVATDLENTVVTYVPDNPDEWDQKQTEQAEMPDIIDQHAVNQFIKTVREEVDYHDAEALAEFLTDTFEVTYTFSGDAEHTGRYELCSSCNGTGAVCTAEECLTYCTDSCDPVSDDKSKPLRVSDEGCSCGGCNYLEHQEQCSICQGEGEILKESFTRSFPYSRDQVLSTYPTDAELKVLQFTIDRLEDLADRNDTTLSVRKVLRLFTVLENRSHEALISQAVEFLRPLFRTVEQEQVNDQGDAVVVEKPDPEAVESAADQLAGLLASS